jgi:hypothetical protein
MNTITNDAIRIESEIDRVIPREHITRRLLQALRRKGPRHATARVTFSDVNGPKGGLDIRCVVQFVAAGRPPISVTSLAPAPRLAFDMSYDTARRAFDRALDRWEHAARRPKKYYAAKRLL